MSVNVYEENSVTTPDRGRLVVMLYDGAIKFLNQALIAIEKKDSLRKGQYITKAQDIIMELNSVLDMEAGGQVTGNLRDLYLFMWKYLNQANMQQDSQKVQKVIDLLTELNRGWRAIAL